MADVRVETSDAQEAEEAVRDLVIVQAEEVVEQKKSESGDKK